jgi:hypothetical protein
MEFVAGLILACLAIWAIMNIPPKEKTNAKNR